MRNGVKMARWAGVGAGVAGYSIKRLRAGIEPGQCSHLFLRILAKTFTTPRLTQPMVGAGT
jgi:hypothetical protein